MRLTGLFRRGKAKQRGASLMIIIVILVVAFAAALVTSLSLSSIKSARQQRTTTALSQAKAALIGYATTYSDTHSGEVIGFLPCPDYDGSNGEGSSPLGACGSQDVSQIGRLPWRTLNLPKILDGDGECLWYAVSGTYKNNPKTGLMNWDTNGQLKAYSSDGTLLTQSNNQAVAVIIAPGKALSGQNRAGTSAPICGGNYTATNYLDNDTSHSINNSDVSTGKFIQAHEHRDANGTLTLDINDQMIFITKLDIWNAIQKRTDFQPTNVNNPLNLMTKRVAECLANFGNNNGGCGWSCTNKSLPWPGQVTLGTNLLTDYYVNNNYNDTVNLYAGRVPYLVGTARATTGNTFPTLMNTSNCPAGWSNVDPWWNNWKDHLFYALAQEFHPTSSGGQSCGWSANCLKINGSGNYAAVIMFAGQKLSSQTRDDKSVVGNYLETPNNTNFSGATGNESYKTAPASGTFNDYLYCINGSLGVSQCP